MPENPEEKLLILQLSEDSRKIARILSNETSIRILKLLDRKSMSAADIADELEVRLNTLKYNLDSLLEAGLIRVRQVKWSRKGREIKVYETVGKMIVLLSGERSSDMSLLLTILRQHSMKNSEGTAALEFSGVYCEPGI
ncbi:transcriptional regulator [Methanosarcina horonobensis HB-1 = JCM 15518]|uniref:Transcriptional regulator n=1 Tax=Methanosarcina horonobensis HB-1 = JCM 15518 TaxID=1434110 RepID=A0A0E3SB33_9EURY|nr:helix-turn-helix domain-containing protein [Methanosarcina horonobensis]AKB78994.1 transcriptional regulator [Methanosarcina horonobensis HB-1 = JCM 15518]